VSEPLLVRVWAPHAERVDLVVGDRAVPMVRGADDVFEQEAPAAHGERYGIRLDGGAVRPDPRAVWLPDGVHSPGAVYHHDRFAWTDEGWTGRPWEQAVVYELHVGTFTPDGTFDAATRRMEHLVDLGVTHVELLPVCAFDGVAGWGYDGVAPWSVHEPYGGPDGLKAFVDAAHRHGLAVILDVVHNHLGPSGAYLSELGPFFTDRYHTPWGESVNLDGPGSDQVRAYLLGSLSAWVHDFHVDGIRLDAVHEMQDNRAVPFLEEISAAMDGWSSRLGRPLVTVAESDRNDPWTVMPRGQGGLGMTAQWDDDVHHALHAWLTGESQGYYADFAADPPTALQTVLTAAFLHAGGYSSFRGRSHGRPVDRAAVPGYRFVASLQTHDQVGNRALGERLPALVPDGHLAAGAALLLLGPFVPMLFMGEEWAASTPWLFFSSFDDPDLAAAVTQGRRAEFADHGWRAADVPDPQAPGTVERSRLVWDERHDPRHAAMLAWYRHLLRLRHTHPQLRDPRLDQVRVEATDEVVTMHRGDVRVAASVADQPRTVLLDRPVGTVLASFGRVAGLDGPSTEVLLGPGSAAVLR